MRPIYLTDTRNTALERFFAILSRVGAPFTRCDQGFRMFPIRAKAGKGMITPPFENIALLQTQLRRTGVPNSVSRQPPSGPPKNRTGVGLAWVAFFSI